MGDRTVGSLTTDDLDSHVSIGSDDEAAGLLVCVMHSRPEAGTYLWRDTGDGAWAPSDLIAPDAPCIVTRPDLIST